MDRLAAELWQVIFRYACTDDGTTGRSLSITSKYIREVSKPVRFQSLRLVGIDQLRAFATLLEKDTGYSRRVHYLFIYDDPRPIVPHVNPFDKRRWNPGRFVSPRRGAQQTDNTEHNEMLKGRDALISTILKFIAPTLKILTMYLQHERQYLLTPVTLPVLRELSVYGEYRPSGEDIAATLQPFPALRRINLHDFYAFASCRVLLGPHSDLDRAVQHIKRLVPSLSHLRATGGHFIIDWGRALGLKPDFSVSRIEQGLPSTVRYVMMGSRTWPHPDVWETENMYVKRDQKGRVIIFKPEWESGSQKDYEETLRQWMDSIDGGEGCWTRPLAAAAGVVVETPPPVVTD